MLYSFFNTAQHHHIEEDILEEINSALLLSWTSFSEEEFTRAITKYNNSSTSGPNRLSWSHLKYVLKDNGVVATTYHKGQMISLTSKPQKKYDVGIHKRTRQGVSA